MLVVVERDITQRVLPGSLRHLVWRSNSGVNDVEYPLQLRITFIIYTANVGPGGHDLRRFNNLDGFSLIVNFTLVLPAITERIAYLEINELPPFPSHRLVGLWHQPVGTFVRFDGIAFRESPRRKFTYSLPERESFPVVFIVKSTLQANVQFRQIQLAKQVLRDVFRGG